jgi:hypothetical protein
MQVRFQCQTDLDPYLLLHDPAGKKAAEDDASGGDLNARLLYRAPVSGTYQLYATTFGPGQVGTFRLTVAEATVRVTPKRKAGP